MTVSSGLARSPWLPLQIVLTPLSLALAAVTPQYESNDDPAMNMIAAGRAIVDKPDEHLIHTNVLIGLTLKQLYTWVPDFPWYGAYLCAAASFALIAIGFLLVQRDRSWANTALVATLILILGFAYLTQLQFTRVAFLCTVAGTLLLLNFALWFGSNLECWIGVPFLLIGSLIRLDAFFLAFVLLSPALLLLLWKARVDVRSRIVGFVLAGSFIASLGLNEFNTWYYERDPAWRGIYEFDRLRAEFIDYRHIPYDETTAPIFSSAGWHSVDFRMLTSWCFLDRERFTVDALKSVVAGVRARDIHGKPQQAKTYAVLASNVGLWAIFGFGLIVLVILRPKRNCRFISVASYAVALLVCLLLYYRRYLPAHVLCPALTAGVIATCFFSSGPRRLFGRWAWNESIIGFSAVVLLMGTVLAWQGHSIWKGNQRFAKWRQHTVEMIETLSPQPDELYLAWGCCFPDQAAMAPLAGNIIPKNFKMLSIGWTTQTPFSLARLNQMGFSDLRSIVQPAKKAYFISQPSQNQILDEYLQEHFGLHVRCMERNFKALGRASVWSISIEPSTDGQSIVPHEIPTVSPKSIIPVDSAASIPEQGSKEAVSGITDLRPDSQPLAPGT